MSYIGRQPTAAALTASDITDGIISNAKLAQDIMSAETALTTEPASTDELLLSDAGTLKRIDYSLISNTPAFRAYRNANVTLSNGTNTIITFDVEAKDTNGMYDNSNGKFTPTISGSYYLQAVVKWNLDGGTNYIELRKNGSNTASMYTTNAVPSGAHVYTISSIVDADGDDYFEVNVYQGSGGDETLYGGAANTFFQGYKLIGA